nr:MAG TPA: hypothetical protein [Caudoviricetes sp.]
MLYCIFISILYLLHRTKSYKIYCVLYACCG